MKMLSLDRLKNLSFDDVINPKIVRFIWKTKEPNICPLCESLDGKVMNSNDPDFMNYQPPLHPRCKCHWGNITSDAEIVPNVNWEKPKEDWIKKYAPFLLVIPFIGKKEPVEITFNKDDILDIEWLNIENTRQQMKDMEQGMVKELYIVFFLGSKGQTVLMKEVEQDIEIDFTNREIELIKEHATQYLISSDNPIVENQIESLFNIKKR